MGGPVGGQKTREKKDKRENIHPKSSPRHVTKGSREGYFHLGPNATRTLKSIHLAKLTFAIRNDKGEVVGTPQTPATNLDKEDGINRFLELLGKTGITSASLQGKKKGLNFLVVTQKRRRLVEKRPIHRLYNQ